MLIVLSVLLAKEVLFGSRTIVIVNPEVAQASEIEPGGVIEPIVASDSTKPKTILERQKSNLKTALPIMKRVADQVGIDWRILYAISGQESSLGINLSGDNGKSQGWYHIYYLNTCEYKQTIYCINSDDRMDIEKATRFTAERLKRHENMGLSEMIRSHNGLPSDNSNAWYPKQILDAMKNADKETASI